MSATDFEFFINQIGHRIANMDTNMRKCIPVQERLAVAPRFLASGDRRYRRARVCFDVYKV
nr:unnamed protein product [Callosobruchus chinensis]